MNDLLITEHAIREWMRNHRSLLSRWLQTVSVDNLYHPDGMETIISPFFSHNFDARILFNEHTELILFFIMIGGLYKGKYQPERKPMVGIVEQINQLPNKDTIVQIVARSWYQLVPHQGAMMLMSVCKVNAKNPIIS